MTRSRGLTRRGNAPEATVPPSATIHARRAWVAKHLTMGHRPTALREMGAAQFNVHPDTITEDLAAVRDQWAEEAAAERPRAREEMLARIDAATLDATSAADRARLLKLRAEVQGLVGPRNVAIAVSSSEALTEEEIRARAEATLRRARERAGGAVGPPDGG